MSLDRAYDLVAGLRARNLFDQKYFTSELELDLSEGRVVAEIQEDKKGNKLIVVQQGGTVLSVQDIDQVILNDPATIVIFKDGTKEVVKTTEGDTYQPDIGVAMALVRKLFGSRSQYKKFVKQFLKEESQEDPAYSVLRVSMKDLHGALEKAGAVIDGRRI